MDINSNQGFASKDIWIFINKISESTKQKKVASAYLGNSVSFKWNPGDVLIIGLSKKNVSDGLIDLDKVEEIITMGVIVYKQENLHAKIYCNDELVVVCSCNLSEASQSKWIEGGIFTSDFNVLQSVRTFFDQYTLEKNLVTKEVIEEFRMVKKENDEQPKADIRHIKERVWVIQTAPIEKEDPITEEVLCNKTEEAKKKVLDPNKVNFLNLRLKDRCLFDIREGDLVIRLTKNDANWILFPLYKCIHTSLINDKLYYINLTQQKGLDGKKWDAVKYLFDGFDPINHRGEIIKEKDKIIQTLFFLFSF